MTDSIFSIRQSKVLKDILKNKFFILLTFAFLTGILFSVFFYGRNKALNNFLCIALKDFISVRTDKTFLTLLLSFANTAFLFLAFLFISGTSVFGAVIVPILLFLRGFFIGSFLSHIYSVYHIKGIAINAVLIIPSELILSVIFIFAALYAMRFSYSVAQLTLPRTSTGNLSSEFKNYCLKYLFLIPFIIISVIVNCVFAKSFIRILNL